MSLPALDVPPNESATTESRVRWRFSESHLPLVVAAIAVAAGLYAVDTLPIGGFYDDAFYVILGKSLATGHGYRNLNLPGAPFATHYPPGYPLLLAALWRIGPSFPSNLVLFKVANALFLGVVAAFAYKLARERLALSIGFAVAATVAGTATTPTLYLSSMLLSEMMFLALVLPFLLWAERRVNEDRPDPRGALWLGVGAGLLFLVRSQAIALVGAVALVYAIRRRWRESALTVAAATIVVLPWLLWVSAHDAFPPLMRGDYGSYFAWFEDGIRDGGPGIVLETLRRNLPDMFGHIAHRFRPPTNPLPDVIASICVLLFAIPGVARLSRRAPVTLGFIAGYLAIVAIWPFAPVRFLLGIWVLIMLVLALGAQTLLESRLPTVAWNRPKMRLAMRLAGGIAAFVLVAGLIGYNVRGYQRRWWATTEDLSGRWIAPKLEWIRSQTDTSAVIATDHDEGVVYLYTGRHAVPITTFTAAEYLEPRSLDVDANALRTLTAHFGAQYLVLSSVRLRPTAAAISTTGVALGDGEHRVVPWAFTLSRRRSR
ncbi:MAG TPA: hypothetical protein VGH98_01380 [Gemmatimonadaceae bacterium]|jgi:hypothetical protein